MANAPCDPVTYFLHEEYAAATAAIYAGKVDEAWKHFERAHIVAQSRLWPHCQSHLRMLAFAIQLRDSREVMGQVIRLVLAPLVNLTGRTPIGNTGRSNVSAFVNMAIPSDIQAVLNSASD